MNSELVAIIGNTQATHYILSSIFDEANKEHLNKCLNMFSQEAQVAFEHDAKMICKDYRLNFIKSNLDKPCNQIDMTYIKKCCGMINVILENGIY